MRDQVNNISLADENVIRLVCFLHNIVQETELILTL